MATAAQTFSVQQNEVICCKFCNEPVCWQRSWKNGKMYLTNVLVYNGQPVSSRSNFHKCDPSKKAAFQRQQLEAAGQTSMASTNGLGKTNVAPKLDMSGVNALFDKAVASGLKYPKIRLQTPSGQPVCLARAGERSRYKGQVMVTDGEKFGYNKYFGRVDQTGTYHPAQLNTEEVYILLGQLGADPAKVAAGYGKLTGNCCFCMRRLEDERSTQVGYGPVCADKWNLPWG